ncbi:MAG: hypothetical protein ACJA1C_002165 [Crocinitomicaceae bacterium]|jgi:hypothetical protein
MSETFWQKIKRTIRDYMSREIRRKRFEEIGRDIARSGEQYDKYRIATYLRTVDQENVEYYLKGFGIGYEEGYKEFMREMLQNNSRKIDIKR